jgi:glycosyltransferase involved in cell wall biosynthesis
MSAVVVAVAGSLDARTGGSIYNRRMVEALGAIGWSVTVVELAGAFPEPAAAARQRAADAFAAMPSGALVLADGLAFSALPDVAEAHGDRLRLVALMHLPIAAAFGLDASRTERFEADERRALNNARGIVITGPGARTALARYGLPTDRMWVVEPGTDPAPLAVGSSRGPLQLLSVGTVHRGKGHDLLLEALAPVAAIEWELTCAGSLTRDPRFVEEVRALVARLGLLDRVRLVGDLPSARLDACYAGADVFVLATRQETYGMAVAEAIRRGIPVVSTDTGAIAAIVGAEAGLLVPPGDGALFGEAIAAVVSDPHLRRRLAAGARARRASLPTWPEAAARMSDVLQGVAGRG